MEYNFRWLFKLFKNVRQNSDNSIKIKGDYLVHLLSYFYQNKINDLKQLSKLDITNFINKVVEKGNISKRRNFYVLGDFLKYLFIENILLEDLSVYVPRINRRKKRKLPTYLKQENIEKLLESIPKLKRLISEIMPSSYLPQDWDLD